MHVSSFPTAYQFSFSSLSMFVPPVLCADRVGQMTKTYNDIDAVTRLLEEVRWSVSLCSITFIPNCSSTDYIQFITKWSCNRGGAKIKYVRKVVKSFFRRKQSNKKRNLKQQRLNSASKSRAVAEPPPPQDCSTTKCSFGYCSLKLHLCVFSSCFATNRKREIWSWLQRSASRS